MRKTKKAPIYFKKFSKKQLKLLTWWKPNSPVASKKGIVAQGAIRTGKSLILSMSFVMWAMETFDQKYFAMCGKTIGSLRRNVVNTLKNVLKNRGYIIQENRSENYMIISKNGISNTFFLFGGKDESSQDIIQGMTLAGVFFDEVVLMPESFVNQATARCSVHGSKWWFTLNPGSPYHYFKTKWIDMADKKNLYVIDFKLDDNPDLTEDIKETYRNMYFGVFAQRYIEGLWVVAEGRIYDVFDPDVHVLKPEQMPTKYDEYQISIDHGVQNATVFLLFGKNENKWYLIKEYYYSGRDETKKIGKHANVEEGKLQKTDVEYMKDLLDFMHGCNVRKIIVDPAASAFRNLLQRGGLRNVRKARKDVHDGIQEVANMLQRKELYVCSTCTHTIEEFGTYSWDPKSLEKGIEQPKKENDHCMDALRYFVYTNIKTPRISVLQPK